MIAAPATYRKPARQSKQEWGETAPAIRWPIRWVRCRARLPMTASLEVFSMPRNRQALSVSPVAGAGRPLHSRQRWTREMHLLERWVEVTRRPLPRLPRIGQAKPAARRRNTSPPS